MSVNDGTKTQLKCFTVVHELIDNSTIGRAQYKKMHCTCQSIVLDLSVRQSISTYPFLYWSTYIHLYLRYKLMHSFICYLLIHIIYLFNWLIVGFINLRINIEHSNSIKRNVWTWLTRIMNYIEANLRKSSAILNCLQENCRNIKQLCMNHFNAVKTNKSIVFISFDLFVNYSRTTTHYTCKYYSKFCVNYNKLLS